MSDTQINLLISVIGGVGMWISLAIIIAGFKISNTIQRLDGSEKSESERFLDRYVKSAEIPAESGEAA